MAFEAFIRTLVKEIKSDIQKQFTSTIEERFEAVDTRFKEVNTRFDEFNTRLDEVNARLDEVKTTIKSIDQHVVARVSPSSNYKPPNSNNNLS